MLSQIQRFGGAMFTPVLLFPFAGIVVGIAIMLRNPLFVGEALTAPDNLFAQIVHIIEEGGWAVFRNMPLIFAVGLPIGLAKQAQGRACLAVLISFLTWNYFINAMGMTWGHFFGVDFSAEPTAGSGLAMIAGIKTLDTSIIGAIIISGLATAIHNRFFDKPLPVFLGIFQGTSFVVILAFFVMIPCAWLTLLGWPKVQMGIESLQAFLRTAGALGVWVYTFLERILIPTGLHHFVYGPFIFGPAAVEGGIQVYWAQHLQEFSQSTVPLKTLFPEGGFALHGNSKVFGSVGIALAIWYTASPENRVKVAGLLIPATLTAVLVGITEPLEFTFLFISPLLFAIHAVLAATMATVMYTFGVVGNMGGGLLDQFLPQNWIPMFHNHASTVFTQIGIGLCFTGIYFVVFRTLIERLNLKTPGREESEIKLYNKADYKAARGQTTAPAAASQQVGQAAGFLQALGGAANIESINNCATRLRIALVDMTKTQSDDVFKALGAHGVVRRGNGIQVIVGLHVPQVRDQLESLMKTPLTNEQTTLTEAIS
ncbi:PTS system alpha-glucoside-specific transporter subunit IICB [Enterobacter hormaechei]|jgi:PTS system arbutin-like IIC component|uniref:Alpha-glucoside-specific PTS transporter subunit IIBC n=2 Tax=Enterobacter hormaechei TaxID=158836 RepID=A0AAE4J4T4_9ENTR|nr:MULTISPECIES: alpha-glucoside-specific PTS transporter subunit IIBC [Enterobacter]CAE7280246.1 PTS system maltose-specific EIICB component [Enterobacter cloacae]VAL63818.1 PTS system alpha-glucoside-specific transporter subunit IICB [Enterobacter kobei]AWV73933.1 PTS alpha-glucoside transporter subunit IICB [Enterobacter hormaechei subsp. xiangfangensis]EHF5036321.1 PTS transporter subunit EIIC [Enterobacter hormaechei]EHF5059866.1 PTS transporter subunit EIIC [Enterobacter hormaechei]